MQTSDVVIVGAGWSGLGAAQVLEAAGRSVRIIERKGEVVSLQLMSRMFEAARVRPSPWVFGLQRCRTSLNLTIER
jgi:flavin-dependent dehydrogenase